MYHSRSEHLLVKKANVVCTILHYFNIQQFNSARVQVIIIYTVCDKKICPCSDLFENWFKDRFEIPNSLITFFELLVISFHDFTTLSQNL